MSKLFENSKSKNKYHMINSMPFCLIISVFRVKSLDLEL